MTMDTGWLRLSTQVLFASAAPLALTTAICLPADADAIPGLKMLHQRTDCAHRAYDFVSRDKRVLAHSPVIVNEVYIAVTDPAMRDAHLNILGPKLARFVFQRKQFRSSRVDSVTLYRCHG
jgi:hypothetical protein